MVRPPAGASVTIHPTALVDPSAILGPDIEVGPWVLIGPGAHIGARTRIGPGALIEAQVAIGEDVQIGPRAVIHTGTTLGAGCVIAAHVVLGAAPQDLKYAGEASTLVIGPGTVFREFATAHRGTGASGCTQVGAGCLLMIGSHIAHDCVVGDHVVMANHVALAGHVHVGDGAVLGGLSAVHQHCRVGTRAMVGGGAMVAADVPPFALAQGDRARLLGLNRVGLARAGWSEDDIRALAPAWRATFSLPRRDDDALRAAFPTVSPLELLLQFRAASTRGLCRLGAEAEP